MKLQTLIRGKSVSYDPTKVKKAEAAILHLNMTGAVALDTALDFLDKGYQEQWPKGSNVRSWLGIFRKHIGSYEYQFNEIARAHGMSYFADMRTKASALSEKQINALREMYEQFLHGRLEVAEYGMLADGYTLLNVLWLHNEMARIWRKELGCDIVIVKGKDGIATVYEVNNDIRDLRAVSAEKALCNALSEIEHAIKLDENWRNADEDKALKKQFGRIFHTWTSAAFGEKAIDYANKLDEEYKSNES